MRVSFILILLFTLSCASEKVRKPASVHSVLKVGEVDSKKSHVQIFPAVADEAGIWYYFFFQLKNAKGDFIDIDPSDIRVKSSKGDIIKFKQERFLTGRYYISLEKTAYVSSNELDFFVQGKPMKEKFKLAFNPPDKAFTKLKMVNHENYRMVFRLKLADNKNRPVEVPEKPEVQLQGNGTIDDMKHVGEGVWEFAVTYPEDNQIMYISVRAMGVFFPKMFRYQHVEK